MPSSLVRVVAMAILTVPFVTLGFSYASLPDQFPVLRTWDGRPVLLAEKSVITVFRIPVIGVVTAAAAELMRRHVEVGPGLLNCRPLRRLWLFLLATACVKSLFEGFELAKATGASPPQASWLGGTTLAVAVGLALAATQLPGAWPTFQLRNEWRLTRFEKCALATLALLYVLFAALPLMFAHPP
jgi:hypothetical protein